MKQILFGLATVVIFAGAASTSLLAQDTEYTSVADRYVISARAGGVNYVEGMATVRRANETGLQLKRGDNITAGERVTLSQHGKAEVLLNPGSYMRVTSGSSFEFDSTSLDDLKIKLHQGTAIFEVFASDEFGVTVETPRSRMVFRHSGIYRIDLGANGDGNIVVYDGTVRLIGSPTVTIKSGQMANLDSNEPMIRKFNKKKLDAFAGWSRDRGKSLTKATASLRNDNVRYSLINSYNSGIWGSMNYFGLWVFDPYYRRYCFMPFGYGWRSPYGFGYGHGIYWYNLPRRIKILPVQPPVGTSNPTFSDRRGGWNRGDDAAAPKEARNGQRQVTTSRDRSRPVDRTVREPVRPPVFDAPPRVIYVPPPAARPSARPTKPSL